MKLRKIMKKSPQLQFSLSSLYCKRVGKGEGCEFFLKYFKIHEKFEFLIQCIKFHPKFLEKNSCSYIAMHPLNLFLTRKNFSGYRCKSLIGGSLEFTRTVPLTEWVQNLDYQNVIYQNVDYQSVDY